MGRWYAARRDGPSESTHEPASPDPLRARQIGLAIVFFWFLIGGILHFAATETELFGVPHWALVARLPLQVALLVSIAWCTRPDPATAFTLRRA